MTTKNSDTITPDKIVRRITIKTPKAQGSGPTNSKSPNVKNSNNMKFNVDKNPDFLSLGDKVDAFKNAAEKLNNKLISGGSRTNDILSNMRDNGLNKIVQNTRESRNSLVQLNDGFSRFSDLLKGKVGIKTKEGKPSRTSTKQAELKSASPKVINTEESTISSITKSVDVIERAHANQVKSQEEQNKLLSDIKDIDEQSTSNEVLSNSNNQKIIEEGLNEEKQKAAEEDKYNAEDKQDRNKASRTAQIGNKMLGSIGNMLSMATRAIFAFSAKAVIASAILGAIFFALVLGFDVLGRYMSSIVNMFDTDFKSFDEKLGVLAPLMETQIQTARDAYMYFKNGEYWNAAKAIFSGIFSTLIDASAAVGLMVSKGIAALLRWVGADETADTMESNALKGMASLTNYRLTEADAEVMARADQRTNEAGYKYARKKNLTEEQQIANFDKQIGNSDKENPSDWAKSEHEYWKNIDGMKKKDQVEAIKQKHIMDNELNILNNRTEGFKTADQITNLLDELKEVSEKIQNNETLTPQLKSIREDQVKIIEQKLEEKLDRVGQKSHVQPPSENEDNKTTERISRAQGERNTNSNNPGNQTTNVQQSQNITNNRSINNVPIQTTRDAPGMYRSTEINA